MKLIGNFKVGTRMAMGFGIVLALMIALTAVAISRMSFIQANLNQLVDVESTKIRLVNEMRDVVRYQSVTIRDVVMQEDFSFKKDEMKLMKQASATYRRAADELGKMLTDPKDLATLSSIVALDEKAKSTMDAALEKSLSDDHIGAGELIRQAVRPAQLTFVAALDGLLKDLESDSKTSAAQASAAYKNALVLISALGSLAVIAGLLTAYLIQRSIALPLRRSVTVAERVADGDLTQSISSKSTDEVGQLLTALGRMSDSLVEIITTIKDSAESVALGSREIASGNVDLSNRTELQASALQQTAASMEELSATVKNNASNACEAKVLATSACVVAARGGETVDEVISTMKDINESSKKIADITSVIDGIAFQTNILALNAAVEAARAGDQGRGFAVVASEVRSLAKRSASAAKEIKALIDESVRRAQLGTDLVNLAGGTMTEVVASIRRVSDIVVDISHATAEQSTGVEQIGEAITQMDQATQQNAALVEQSAAAAESLSEHAQQLLQAVSVFKLNPQVHAPHPVLLQ